MKSNVNYYLGSDMEAPKICQSENNFSSKIKNKIISYFEATHTRDDDVFEEIFE
jgi:hypothetical protein